MHAHPNATSTLAHAEALQSELSLLSAELEAATHRQLTLIRELEPTMLWASHGATSYTGWLGWLVGLAPAAAREKVRVARALAGLPRIDAAFAKARLSYSKVRAITRVADASNEEALLEMAIYSTASQLERICRGIRSVVRNERGEIVDPKAPERWVRVRPTEDGMSRLEASLHPDEAALVMKAIELARGIGGSTPRVIDAADALLKVVDAYLGGAREGRSGERTELVVHVTPQLVRAAESGEGATAEAAAAVSCAVSDESAERASAEASAAGSCAVSDESDESAPAEARATVMCACLEDGTRVAPEALRRLGCDASIVPVRVDEAGLPIDVGRKTRVVRSALRRALFVRDGGGCRFPGCDHRGWIDAHHVEHWIDGGATVLGNLVSLCPAHHRLVHEGGLSVELCEGRAVFRDAESRVLPDAPETPMLAVTWLDDWRASAEAQWTDEPLLSRWNGRAPDYRACVVAGLPRASSA